MARGEQRKVCIVGAFGVGKTSLVRRAVHDDFTADYRATLGVAIHKLPLDTAATGAPAMTLLLWDIEGEDGLRDTWEPYLVGGAASVVVADLTRPETLDGVPRLLDRVAHAQPGRPVAIALNKADAVPADAAGALHARLTETLAGDSRVVGLTVTSAATGTNVMAMFAALSTALLGRGL